VYQALGGTPPDYLAQPIAGAMERPSFAPQSAYIHPRVTGDMVRYFEWMGAARYTADRRSGSMHGKQFLLDAIHAGIDEQSVYGRLDFIHQIPDDDFQIVVNVESWESRGSTARQEVRLEAVVEKCEMRSWKATSRDGTQTLASAMDPGLARVALARNFEFRLPLTWLQALPRSISKIREEENSGMPTRLRLRFSLWSNRLPVDALPVEGWIELELLNEEDLVSR
jgi:hypothetical protein